MDLSDLFWLSRVLDAQAYCTDLTKGPKQLDPTHHRHREEILDNVKEEKVNTGELLVIGTVLPGFWTHGNVLIKEEVLCGLVTHQ
jgi:uncharacterized protein YdhG (YjbR/CyaY superfamily)